MLNEKHICIQYGCGDEFEISEGEKEFYKDRKLDEPKRCPPCRQKNKLAANKKEHE